MGAPRVGVQVTSRGRGQGSRSLCAGPGVEERGLSGEEFRRIWVTAKGSGRVSHVHAVQKQNGLKRFDGKVDKTVRREPRGLSPGPGQRGREVVQGLRAASRPLCGRLTQPQGLHGSGLASTPCSRVPSLWSDFIWRNPDDHGLGATSAPCRQATRAHETRPRNHL